MSAPLLVAKGVSKRFPPAVQALASADLELCPGEVHALVGENGAGKSTLSRIVAGLEQPSEGEIFLRGERYSPASRAFAESRGVRMVMQELNLVSTLSVAENIFLDRIPHRFGLISRRALGEKTATLLAEVGLQRLDPDTPVSALGIGQQQLVEIARGLSARCDLLILDEPTAALTSVETEALFAQIRRLTEGGVAILYISHRLEEIVRIARKITVLRDGAVVASRSAEGLAVPEIIRLMVGRSFAEVEVRSKNVRSELGLRVANLRTRTGVRDVSFDLRRGEIFGLAGLMGSGRTETLRAIFAADAMEAGSVFLGGAKEPARIKSPRDAVRGGIALLTEDRKNQGLLLPWPVRENVSLAKLQRLADRAGFVSKARESSLAAEFVRSLRIRAASVEQPVRELSGGNQQKVVIAKWLFRETEVLMFDEPTRGIDIGARFEIYQLLVALAGSGKSILVVSSELAELFAICNRIAVLSRGKLVRTFEPSEYNQDAIMTAALSEYR